MKCLVPLMTKSPPCCTALVFIPRRSEPACGSLMARHSTRSPHTLKPLRCTAGKRIASLAIAALAATGLALISSNDFINRFGDFLALLLYLFTPWTAINLVDFYIVRKGHYSIREIFNPNGMYGRWNWRGLLAYGTGSLVMIPFFSTPTYQGPVARADRRHGARPVRTRPLRYYSINAHSAAWRQLSFARHIRVHASPGTSPRRRAAGPPGRQPHFPWADASVQHTTRYQC
jgi:hypothetical protein